MVGFEDDAYPLRLEVFLQPVCYLDGEAFLDLEVPGEQLHHPGQLGQPQDPFGGYVADVGHAVEGQEVVLAQRVEGDVPGQDQLVVALVVGEGGEVERLGRQELGIG